MAEATATPKKEPKKEPNKETRKAQPVDDGLLTGWRTWGVVGVVVLGGLVAWKLLGSSYKSDVETICNAEKGSGFTIDKDMSKVTQWVRGRLATPEGNELFSTLSDAKLADRAKRLQGEADSLKVGACPMVPAYQALAASGEYRADVQHLCSSILFPKLAELDDADRLARLQGWVDTEAKSPRTKELAGALRQAPAAERAKLLRDAATKVDIFSCDTARVLDSPQAEPPPKGPPRVRVYAEPQIVGPVKPEDLAKAIADVTPAMNDCYEKGLAKAPDLEARVAIKMGITTEGKVAEAGPADATIQDHEVVTCIVQALKGMKLPPNPGPLVSAFVPLEMTTKPLPPAPPPRP
ncbi:MAG TPA: AgmX/PglI C-terminal domain-containing protein [Polyangiaceae bacterium]|jgi:hypothetical protein